MDGDRPSNDTGGMSCGNASQSLVSILIWQACSTTSSSSAPARPIRCRSLDDGCGHRGRSWLNDLLHARFREVMLHAAAREALFFPTYCLMSDHIHLVWLDAVGRDTDQPNGMKFLREHVGKLLRIPLALLVLYRLWTFRGNHIGHNFIHHTGGVGMGRGAVQCD